MPSLRRLLKPAVVSAGAILVIIGCSSSPSLNPTGAPGTTATTTTQVNSNNNITAPTTMTVVLPSALPRGTNGLHGGTVSGAAADGRQADLDAFVTGTLAQAQLPGLSTCLVRRGQVIFCKGYGYADLDRRRRMAPATPVLLGPVTQLVTALVVMKQQLAGDLDLDDPVSDALDFPLSHPSGEPITYRQLLAQAGGLRDSAALEDFVTVGTDGPLSLGEALQAYLDPAGDLYDALANFTSAAPGTSYQPATIGSALLGYALQRLAGGAADFAELAQTELFDADVANMEETGFRLADFDEDPLALLYHPDQDDRTGYASDGQPAFADYPGRGLRSSARSLARLLAAVRPSGDGDPDGLRAAFDQMVPLFDPEVDPRQGLGLRHRQIGPDGDDWVGQRGGLGDAWAEAFVRLSDGMGLVILTNGRVEDDQPIKDIESVLLAFAETL